MSVTLPLRELLTALGDSLQTIDIRCAVKRFDPGWISLLTAIRISARSLEETHQRYKDLQTDGLTRNADPFRILWQCYPIADAEDILKKLASAQLSVEGELVRLPQPGEASKFRGQLELTSNLLMPWNQERWPATVYYSSENRTISFSDEEIRIQVRRSRWQSPEQMTAHFLGLNRQELYRTNIPLLISVEMPAKIAVQVSESKMPHVQAWVHSNVTDFALTLNTDRDGTKPLPLPLEKRYQERSWVIYRSPLDAAKLEPDDSFSLTLSHHMVPVLDEVTGFLRNYLPIAYVNPLLLCLQHFWNLDEFRNRLERPYDKPSGKKDHNAQHVFQQVIAHMLTLAGFQAVNLGEEEFLYGEGTKVRRATLDILAYHAGSKILILGACTLTPPKTEDIHGVLETTAILRGKCTAHDFLDTVIAVFDPTSRS